MAASPEAAGTTPEAGATTPEAAGSPQASGSSPTDVTVVSVDIDFNPNEFIIPANTDVTVTLPNEGVAEHTFVIDELEINVSIAPGATETVTINAPAGTYTYYCDVPGHRAQGMEGTMTVE